MTQSLMMNRCKPFWKYAKNKKRVNVEKLCEPLNYSIVLYISTYTWLAVLKVWEGG